jgi:hypothetical protein
MVQLKRRLFQSTPFFPLPISSHFCAAPIGAVYSPYKLQKCTSVNKQYLHDNIGKCGTACNTPLLPRAELRIKIHSTIIGPVVCGSVVVGLREGCWGGGGHIWVYEGWCDSRTETSTWQGTFKSVRYDKCVRNLVWKPEEIRHLVYQDVYMRIILILILKKGCWVCGCFFWVVIGSSVVILWIR